MTKRVSTNTRSVWEHAQRSKEAGCEIGRWRFLEQAIQQVGRGDHLGDSRPPTQSWADAGPPGAGARAGLLPRPPNVTRYTTPPHPAYAILPSRGF